MLRSFTQVMNQLKPMIIVLLMLTSALAGCTGTDGAEGIPGPKGETGDQGPPGIQGETGSAGADGQNGIDGQNGVDGQNGADGQNGVDGQNGADGQNGIDGIDVDESRIALLEAELASKDLTIAILLGNISDMEGELEAVDNVIEMYYMMFVQIQNDINWQNQTRDLSGIFLGNANLRFAELAGADLSYADLTYANLNGADLRVADLSYTNMNNADLRYANLNGADLSGAWLNNIVWSDTTCPDGTNSDNNGDTCENNL